MFSMVFGVGRGPKLLNEFELSDGAREPNLGRQLFLGKGAITFFETEFVFFLVVWSGCWANEVSEKIPIQSVEVIISEKIRFSNILFDNKINLTFLKNSLNLD